MRILLVVLGAGLGAPLRYAVDHAFRRRFEFPLGILIVNAAGSFLLGLVSNTGPEVSALLGSGFSGALTTWSTFAIDLDSQRHKPKRFLLNLFSNVSIGFIAAALGQFLAN